MNSYRYTRHLLAMGLAASMTACTPDQPPAPPAAAEPVAAPAEKVVPAAPVQAKDPAAPDALKAGLEAVQPRVLATVDGFKKIEATPQFRFFMHPLLDKSPSMEIDTTGLSSLSLSPRVGDLSVTPNCDSPSAGIVELSWSMDGAAPATLIVDRTYSGKIDLDVSNSKRLLLTVSHGNNEITCDWFAVGFLDVVAK